MELKETLQISTEQAQPAPVLWHPPWGDAQSSRVEELSWVLQKEPQGGQALSCPSALVKPLGKLTALWCPPSLVRPWLYMTTTK